MPTSGRLGRVRGGGGIASEVDEGIEEITRRCRCETLRKLVTLEIIDTQRFECRLLNSIENKLSAFGLICQVGMFRIVCSSRVGWSLVHVDDDILSRLTLCIRAVECRLMCDAPIRTPGTTTSQVDR